MIRLIVALVAALSPAALLYPASAPEGVHTSETRVQVAGPHDLAFDHSLLPGPTGWFLVPVTVASAADVMVSIDMVVEDAEPGASPAATLVASPWGLAMGMASMGSGASLLEVNHEGTVATCCAEAGVGPSSTSGQGGEMNLRLEPGEVLWVGLMAVSWESGSSARFLLQADTPLIAGVLHQGIHVEAVDLVAEARAAGRNVHALGAQVGDHGTATIDFIPQGTGILAFDYFALGGVSGRVTATVGTETVFDEQEIAEGLGMLRAAKSQPMAIALTDLRFPSLPPLYGVDPDATPPHAMVYLLFADVDVAFDSLESWTDLWGEDE